MKSLMLQNSCSSAVVDSSQFSKASTERWYLTRKGYVACASLKPPILLHEFLFGSASKGKMWDHRSRNKLDNRRKNLRKVIRSQNILNSGVRRDNTSGFRGVDYHETSGLWRARASINGKPQSLGYFTDPIEAAKVRDAVVRKHDSRAFLNFPMRFPRPYRFPREA